MSKHTPGGGKYKNSLSEHMITYSDEAKYGPHSRPVHSAGCDGDIVNGDPDRHYVKANSHDRDYYNYNHYLARGYRIERMSKDTKVSIVMGSPAEMKDPLTWRGMVLMSCSRENYNRIFNEGPTGNTGQMLQDKMMRRIQQGNLDKRISVDGLQQQESFTLLGGKPDVFR